MATTEVELCNLALFRVRATEIGDLNEQSINAEKCRVLYSQVRDYVLSDGIAWGFAKKTRALSLTGVTPEEWTYEYDYPNDALVLLYIVKPGVSGVVSQSGINLTDVEMEHIPYEILEKSGGGTSIGTNYADAKAAYIKSVTDVRQFPPLFEDAVAWRLAYELAVPLGGDSTKYYRDAAANGYEMAKGKALAQHGNQRWPRLKQQRPREIQARAGGIYSRNFNGQPYWR